MGVWVCEICASPNAPGASSCGVCGGNATQLPETQAADRLVRHQDERNDGRSGTAAICFIVVGLVGAAAWLPDATVERHPGAFTVYVGALLSLLAWLVVAPILGVWAARHGDTRELLGACLGAATAAAGTWIVAGLIQVGFKVPEPKLGDLVPLVLIPAGWVGVLCLVSGGIRLLHIQERRIEGSESARRD